MLPNTLQPAETNKVDLDAEQDKAFHEAKAHLTSECLLIHYDPQIQTKWIWMLNRIKHFMKPRLT